jgi:hypothetical protein
LSSEFKNALDATLFLIGENVVRPFAIAGLKAVRNHRVDIPLLLNNSF